MNKEKSKYVVIFILIFSIVSISSYNVFAEENDTNEDHVAPLNKIMFIGGEGNKSLDIITKTNFLEIKGSWNNNSLLSIYFFENDNNKTVFYGNFIDSFEITLSVKNNTRYKILFENPGINDVTSSIEINDTPKSQQEVTMGGIVQIALIMAICIISISCIYVIYRFRVLVSIEKRSYNRTLEKLIKLYKVDPDKVLDIIREMNNSASMEGFKLVDSLSTITDRFTKEIKNNKF